MVVFVVFLVWFLLFVMLILSMVVLLFFIIVWILVKLMLMRFGIVIMLEIFCIFWRKTSSASKNVFWRVVFFFMILSKWLFGIMIKVLIFVLSVLMVLVVCWICCFFLNEKGYVTTSTVKMFFSRDIFVIIGADLFLVLLFMFVVMNMRLVFNIVCLSFCWFLVVVIFLSLGLSFAFKFRVICSSIWYLFGASEFISVWEFVLIV